MIHRVLLIANASPIQELIENYFMENGHGTMQLELAEDGKQGIEKVYDKGYDLILLDAVLPEMSGFAVCREIRKRSSSPIIFLLERNYQEDILKAYRLGGDDYVVKPFDIAELFAKANAILRRSKGMGRGVKLVCGSISLAPYSMEVWAEEQEVILPNKEYLMLKTFMEQPGRVFSREQMLMNVWGYDYTGNERVVDNHIKKLRKLLGRSGGQIETVNGRGYRLTAKNVSV